MGINSPLAAALLVLLLGACAAQQPQPGGDATWDEHETRLRALTHWSASGKLALRTPDMSESANLQWQQRAGRTQLQLSGPLGVNPTTLTSDGVTLEIQQGEESRVLDLADPQELARRTGWELPLLALPHWLKGAPAPELDIQFMAFGAVPSLLQTLQQDDWEISYEQYRTFRQLDLPTRLHIRRADTSVKVIISDWQLEES